MRPPVLMCLYSHYVACTHDASFAEEDNIVKAARVNIAEETSQWLDGKFLFLRRVQHDAGLIK
jgi:hypothetical protein